MSETMKKVKILHATMSLDIGGAETHIVELAKYLNRMDYEIIVASNGGVYEQNLAQEGIKHYKVPLYTKNPFKVIASYFLLKKLIKDEQIDIVHAHARIPAFISGIICKQLNAKIVTTTHGRFKVNWLLRKLSNWGDKSIAVSQDLKSYLIDEYDYLEEDVYLSVNGIDTQVFKPKVKVQEDTKNIVHVSRLDKETSIACTYMIASAPKLYQLDPKLRLIVAGGGTELEVLKAQAKEMNQEMGFEMITMLGPISDVPALLDRASIFVGISRAFLEAMNYEIPMVLAGDPGMMGNLEQSMLKRCEGHNYTCRDERPIDQGELYKEIVKAYKSIGQDRRWMGSYIRENYGVSNMAEPYNALYKDLIAQPKKYVIAGYYGYSNSGDDALLNSTCRDIYHYNNDNDITILTNETIDKKSNYMAKSVYRFNLGQVLKAIKQSDVLIMGGGSLLQDKTSSRSIWYYLAIIWLANRFKKKTYLYANGVGPVNRGYNRWLTHKIVNKVNFITLRESRSREELANLKIDKPYIQVTADPVFSLPFDEPRDIDGYLSRAGIDLTKPYCTAIYRSWINDSSYVDKIASICDYVKETYDLQILFIPMKFPVDQKVESAIMAKMTNESHMLGEKCDVQTLVEIIGKSKLGLSMRLHGILYSALKEVPVVGFSYDVKIDYYTQVLDMPLVPDIMNVDVAQTKRDIDSIMSNYDQTKVTLAQKLKIQKAESRNNAELLRKLF